MPATVICHARCDDRFVSTRDRSPAASSRPSARRAPSTASTSPCAGLRLRRPRAQRRGQDDHDPHARHAAAARRAARRRCSATTSSRRPTRSAAAVSLTGQLASVDEDLTGRENLVLLARLLGFDARRGARRARTSCSSVRPRRRRRAAGQELLGRHAAPARHRREPPRHARSSCSSTSRRRGSTRARATRSGTSSARSSPPARRSCCARSTSTRPTSSPTASR